MVSLKFATLALAALRAYNVFAELEVEAVEELEDEVENLGQTPALAVKASATFPDSEIFGIKLVNGHPTRAVLSVTNEEPEPITVSLVGGSLIDQDGGPNGTPVIVRNLTLQRFGLEIPAGAQESLTYSFAIELHPRDLQLNLAAVLSDAKGAYYTMQVFNGTVSVVEAPISFFDPQIIFLYLTLTALFLGTGYFILKTWLPTIFPQKRRGGKGGERAKASSKGSKKVDPSEQVGVVGADGPAVTSSSKAYDESWIPAAHLQRPEAKKVRSGTPKTKVRAS